MGTHGTTHIKKGTKIIDLTDSYDGYFSAMGFSNFLSIKYISDKVMNKLVDAFNDLEYKDYDEVEISQRSIDDALFQMEKDLKNNPAGLDWAKRSLEEVRPSITGFGPILYLGINPSYNEDQSPCYLIDLDNKEFSSLNHTVPFKLTFDTIRSAPESLLKYFSEAVGGSFDLVEGSNYEELEEQYNQITMHKYSRELTQEENNTLIELTQKIQLEVESVFKISPEKLKSYEEEQEILNKEQQAQRLAYLAEQAALNKNSLDEESSGFSIRSANNISFPQLRKIITYIQKYIEVHPQASFLEKTVEWGFNEDGKDAAFRIFSPKKSSQDAMHEEVINTLEYQFKIGMNGYSSSGTYSFGDEEVKEVSFFGEPIPGPQQTLYKLEEIRQLDPDWESIIKDADPTVAYYVYYEDARNVVLSHDLAHENYSLSWAFTSLLNQDDDVFNKVYPTAQKVFNSLPKEQKKMAATSFLQSIVDSEQINALLGLENNPGFKDLLKNAGLFDDVKPFMNKKENALYFPTTAKKMKK